jgi:hypothetical protein
MCCIAQIAMSVMGIVTLVKGSFSLSRRSVVRGPAAYTIGIILTATLPALLGLGFVIGMVLAIRQPGKPPDLGALVLLDPIVVVVILGIVATIAITNRQSVDEVRAEEQFPAVVPSAEPRDLENPYSAPQATLAPPTSRAQPVAPPPPPPATGPQWYYSLDGTTVEGPVSGADLRNLIAAGTLLPTSQITNDGKTWHPAARLKGVTWPTQG